MGKKAKNDGLGRALTRRRAQEQRDAAAARRNHQAGEKAHRHQQPQLQSILDATDLEELMQNADRANEVYGGPGMAVPLAPQTVVVAPVATISPSDAKRAARELDDAELRIPRRPPWDEHTTPAQLKEQENSTFLEWRRNVAEVEESLRANAGFGGITLTPFEKNLDVWRQLWRVVERSDIVVQIVDARNPLLYYCPDLYRFVVDEMERKHLLLVNKADLLTPAMISRWEHYFEEQRIPVLFFSAFKASVNEQTHDARIMNAEQLIDRLHGYPHTSPITRPNQRVVVGMVGYPNVGKSSTINILLETAAAQLEACDEDTSAPHEAERTQVGDVRNEEEELSPTPAPRHDSTDAADSGTTALASKRVAVSATPGKTKHFQTLVLSDRVMLCDCPGLVFPNFSASKSELICAGVLSIDQMRGDALSPMSLVARRIPASIFEGVYGIQLDTTSTPGLLETEDNVKAGHVSATMLLETHARARGFMSDHDKADLFRSARFLLKEYVSGRISFAHGPPPGGEDEGEAGVGPEVFAKKGKLMYVHQLQSEAADDTTSRIDGAVGAPARASKSPSAESRPERQKGTGTTAIEGIAPLGKAPRTDGDPFPYARMRRGKKNAPQVFTRVERSYYPSVE